MKNKTGKVNKLTCLHYHRSDGCQSWDLGGTKTPAPPVLILQKTETQIFS